VSNPFQRKLTTEHKQIHEENLKKRKEELRKMILDDVRASVKGLSPLLPTSEAGKEGWKGFMYLASRYRKRLRDLQNMVNDPELSHDKRLTLIGERVGIEEVFTFVRNILSYARRIDTDKGASEVIDFIESQHYRRRPPIQTGGK